MIDTRTSSVQIFETELGTTLKQLITVHGCTIKRTRKTRFHMACKEGQFDVAELMVNDQFKTFSINLNTQHVTGMTPFDLAVHMYGYKTL